MSSGKKKIVELKKNTKLRRAIVSCVVMVLLVVAGVVLVLSSDSFGSNSIRRFFSYLSVSTGFDGTAEQYSFGEHTKNSFASYNNGLAIATIGGLYYYDKNGAEALTVPYLLKNPALTSGKTAACAYDIGGTALLMFNTKGLLTEINTDKSIIAAKINNTGYLSLICGETGSKAMVIVYNALGEAVFKYHSTSSYLTSSAVSQDNVYMSCVAIGQNNSRFVSRLITFRLDSEELYSQCELGEKAVLDTGYFNNGVMCVVTESSLIMTDGLSILDTYDYSGKYLRDFEVAPEGYTALALNKYKAGSRCTVVTVDSASNVIGSVEYTDEILSISASGGYVAVLTSDSLTVYNSDLSVYSRLDDTGSAKSVIIRDDGTALLIGGSSARIYIP